MMSKSTIAKTRGGIFCIPFSLVLLFFLSPQALGHSEGSDKADKKQEQKTDDPVSIITGDLSDTSEDIFVAGTGLPLEFSREYHSQTSFSSFLGFGWTHNYDTQLFIEENRAILHYPDGTEEVYARKGDEFISPPGVYDKLSKRTENVYVLREKNGTQYYYNTTLGGPDSGKVELIEEDFESIDGTPPGFKEIRGGWSIVLDEDNKVYSADTSVNRKERAESYLFRGSPSFILEADIKIAALDPENPDKYAVGLVIDANANKEVPHYQIFFRPEHLVIKRNGVEEQSVAHQTGIGGSFKHLKLIVLNGKLTVEVNGNPCIQNLPLTPLIQPYVGLRVKYAKAYFDNLRYESYYPVIARLTKIEDRNGNKIKIKYDGWLPKRIIHTSGQRELRLKYNKNNLLTKVIDPVGNSLKYKYNRKGLLVEAIDQMGNSTKYSYDDSWNMINKTDKRGSTTTFKYAYAKGERVSKIINSLGGITELQWGDYQVDVIDHEGNFTRYNIEQRETGGVITKAIDALGREINYTYTQDGEKKEVIDQEGNKTRFGYDQKGNLTLIEDALGNQTTFTYDLKYSLLTSLTDPLAHPTTYEYDANGNLIKVTDALGNKSIYTYDAKGQLLTLQDARGNITSYDYDEYGNPIKFTNALGNKTLFTYDLLGNLLTLTDANGNVIDYNYDELNRLEKITYVDGTTVDYTYDNNGNRTSVTDQKRNITQYSYDKLNRLVRVTDAAGKITEYGYDKVGNRTILTDGNGNITRYNYDKLNRLEEVITPSGKITKYEYDKVGNRTSLTDANSNTNQYEYDAVNRLIEITYPDFTTVEFSYDGAGRRIQMNDSVGITTYTYDNLNRLIGVTAPGSNNTIIYNYDEVGNRIKMTNQDGGITTYEYDSLNRLVSLIDSDNQTTNYSYDVVSHLTQMTYPNNTVANYTFDNLNRLISLSNKTTAEDIISSYVYEYDPVGMRTKITLVNGDYISYSYDALNQLISEEKRDSEENLLYSYTYTFDPVGNRLTMVKDTVSASYAYNEENQLISEDDGNTLTGYSYDNNGNLINKIVGVDITSYAYDYENRLTNIAYPDSSISVYAYDGTGKRTQTVEEGITTKFLYDGLTAIIERDISETTTATYNRGLSYGDGIGGIISKTYSSGQSLYYQYDGIGTVTSLTDSVENIMQTYEIDAFGNILLSIGNVENSYQFLTKELSSKSGLHHYGFRYYDSRIGRFITKDPMGIIDGPNMYLYVKNNPVNFIDLYGLYKSGDDFVNYYRNCIAQDPWNPLYILSDVLSDPYIDIGQTEGEQGYLYNCEVMTAAEMGNYAAGELAIEFWGPLFGPIALIIAEGANPLDPKNKGKSCGELLRDAIGSFKYNAKGIAKQFREGVPEVVPGWCLPCR